MSVTAKVVTERLNIGVTMTIYIIEQQSLFARKMHVTWQKTGLLWDHDMLLRNSILVAAFFSSADSPCHIY